MNHSQADPLRHLKRIRNRTPSKASSSKQLSRTEHNFGNSSIMGLMESKLEETALLKENCYDANKYYSRQCEEYLNKIGYGSGVRSEKKISETKPKVESIDRQKTVQSEDSLNEVFLSKEKPINANNQEMQVLTFKKLSFEQQSSSHNKKTPTLQKQLSFQPIDPFTADTQPDGPGELIACTTCGRKFNPTSFEKHARVCQKVFVKKRRQFSSQKQRSCSRDSKA